VSICIAPSQCLDVGVGGKIHKEELVHARRGLALLEVYGDHVGNIESHIPDTALAALLYDATNSYRQGIDRAHFASQPLYRVRVALALCIIVWCECVNSLRA